MSNDIIIPGDEAYLSFGGWAKPMPNPPGLHERRRYIVDVECTDASLKTSSKGERGTRSLSILRVAEVTGVVVPPKADNDEDDATPPMFNDDGSVSTDASADEGDEIMAKRAEDKAAAQADDGGNDDDWAASDGSAEGSADDVDPAEDLNNPANVHPMRRAADGE